MAISKRIALQHVAQFSVALGMFTRKVEDKQLPKGGLFDV